MMLYVKDVFVYFEIISLGRSYIIIIRMNVEWWSELFIIYNSFVEPT